MESLVAMDEKPELPLTKPRGRGRPKGTQRVTESRSAISVWIPTSAHDRLIKLAKEQEQSIGATVRQLLKIRL